MSLADFLLTLKHLQGKHDQHSHAGSRGAGVNLPENPTSLEYSNYRLFQKENLDLDRPVFFRQNQLPPVPPGYTRIYHGTDVSNIESIDKKGLLTGSESGKKERLNVVLGTTQDTSNFGNISVVVDLPKGKFRKVNEDWAEFGKVSPENITGYYVSKIQGDIDDIIPIYQDYNKLYGDK